MADDAPWYEAALLVGVTQMFSSYTKIADTLQLEPDMGDIAAVDHSPAPGGSKPSTRSAEARSLQAP